jgi:uncharacterized protein
LLVHYDWERPLTSCTAFSGSKRIASGDLDQVAMQTKALLDEDLSAQVLIFDNVTSEPIEMDLRGTPERVLQRIAEKVSDGPPISETASAATEPRGPGRPKLGVVAREVTLLPRHWEWLASQPGGASVALRRLVDEARRANQSRDLRRRAQESAYRFLSSMAGNETGFEEAIRSLFAGRQKQFNAIVESWPRDVRDHAKGLAAAACSEPITDHSMRPSKESSPVQK